MSATQGNPSTMVLSPLGLTWGLMGASPVSLSRFISRPGCPLGGPHHQRPGHDYRQYHLRPVDTGLDPLAGPRRDGVVCRSFIVIVGTAISFTAFVTGISEIGPMKATLIGTLEPVIASVTSALVLGTTFHPVELVGYAASSQRYSSSSCRKKTPAESIS